MDDNDCEEELTPRQFFARANAEKRDYMREWAYNQNKPKEYIKLNETYDAYGYVLDTGERAIPALEYVAALHNKDAEWVGRVKNNPLHKDILRITMEAHKQHPTTLVMQDKALLGVGHKRSIKTGRSISAVLNALSDNVQVANRIVALENRVDTLEAAVLQLAHQANADHLRLNNLEVDVQSLTKNQKREKALQLYSEGVTIQTIADKLGKDRKTIRNWIK